MGSERQSSHACSCQQQRSPTKPAGEERERENARGKKEERSEETLGQFSVFTFFARKKKVEADEKNGMRLSSSLAAGLGPSSARLAMRTKRTSTTNAPQGEELARRDQAKAGGEGKVADGQPP